MTTYQKGDAVMVRTARGLWPGEVVRYTESGKIEVRLLTVSGRRMPPTHGIWPEGGWARGVYVDAAQVFRAPGKAQL